MQAAVCAACDACLQPEDLADILEPEVLDDRRPIHDRPGRGLIFLHHGARGDDLDGPQLHCCGPERCTQLRRDIGHHLDVGEGLRLIADQADLHPVQAGRDAIHEIKSAGIARRTQRRADQDDIRSGEWLIGILVADCPGNFPCLSGGHRTGRQDTQGKEKQECGFHSREALA